MSMATKFPGMATFVEPDATDTRNFRVDAGVMVAKETDARPKPCQNLIQTRRLADIARSLTMPRETYACRHVMRQRDVDAADAREPLNLVRGVVSLGITLEAVRTASVIGWTVVALSIRFGSGHVPKSPTCST
jgi:hypothetical protein